MSLRRAPSSARLERRHRVVRPLVGLVALGFAAVGIAGVLAAPGRAAEQVQAATITRKAYFTYPLTQTTPPLVTNGFPPTTACLVAGLAGAAQICGPEVIGVGEALGLSDGLPIPETPDGEVFQPVVPGTTPVGMLSGQQRYATLLQLRLPALADGEEFGSFDLVLRQDGLNFALESPAFREAVLAAISQAEVQDPAAFADLIQRIADMSVPLMTQTVTGIEACPIVENWNGGDAQNAALDGKRVPAADCLRGSAGVYDPQAGTWTFDLAFAAQAWTTGSEDGEVLPNQGIILRAAGAPNLAYGDPDVSTNWVVSLADDEGAVALRPQVKFSTVPGDDAGDDLDGDDLVTDDFGDGGLVGGPDEPVSIGELGSDAGSDDGDDDVSLGPLAGSDGGSEGGSPRNGGPSGSPVGGTSAPKTSALLWLLIPIALAGAYTFGESVLAAPAVQRHRPGAMSRLMELREGGQL